MRVNRARGYSPARFDEVVKTKYTVPFFKKKTSVFRNSKGSSVSPGFRAVKKKGCSDRGSYITYSSRGKDETRSTHTVVLEKSRRTVFG